MGYKNEWNNFVDSTFYFVNVIWSKFNFYLNKINASSYCNSEQYTYKSALSTYKIIFYIKIFTLKMCTISRSALFLDDIVWKKTVHCVVHSS